MDENFLKNQYKDKLPQYERLREEAQFILNSIINEAGIKIHNLSSRLKNYNSFLNKVKRKDIKVPFKDINDIVGLRIVCLFKSDIKKIGELIRSNFEVISEDNKLEDSDIAYFGYLSIHFIVRIKKNYSGPRYKNLHDTSFEIQLRTIAMDTWATISHYLDYKSQNDVPTDLRKDFYALSGLLYIVDTHFEMFYEVSAQSRKEVEKLFSKEKPELDQEINLDTLTVYLRKRFPDRQASDTKRVSELVNELINSDYKYISDLDVAISKGWHAFEIYENNLFPKDASKFLDTGVVYTLLSIYDKKFLKNRNLHSERERMFREYKEFL
ncbi:MAG: GTP pyrophosphokinase [bacterium]